MVNRVIQIISVTILLSLTVACASGPKDFLGYKFGIDVQVVKAKLGIKNNKWVTWFSDKRFKVCHEDGVAIFNKSAKVMIVGQDGKFVGVIVKFKECTPDRAHQIKKDIVEYYKLETKTATHADIYQCWGGEIMGCDKMIHFDPNSCSLIVAVPDFAQYSADQKLKSGLGGLINSMQPH